MDYALETTFDVKFTSRNTSGVPTTLAGTPDIDIYEDNGTTQITGADTLTADFDAITGLNNLRIAATAANGFESGKSYSAVISSGTVGGTSVVGEVVCNFSIERSAAATDLANGTDGLGAIKSDTAATLVDTADMQPKLGTVTDLGGGATLADNNSDIAGATFSSSTDSLEVIKDALLTAAAVNSEVDTALQDIGLDHLISAAVTGSDIADDSIIAQLADDAATADWDNYDNTANSLQALRVQGDAAWTTGGGGSLTQIINVVPRIPSAINIGDTAATRIGCSLVNSVDDLPTAAEITPGTISIDRKEVGGTSWSNVVNAAAMSELDGEVYYDEVFDTSTGYEEGDQLRFSFASVAVVADSNTYEIFGVFGSQFYSYIREHEIGAGFGAFPATVTVTDGTNPIQGASVMILDGSTTVGLGTTDASGNYTFSLNSGTYTASVTKPNYTFSPVSRTVTGTETGTLIDTDLEMTAVSVPSAPADASLCRVFGYIERPDGTPAKHVTIDVALVAASGGVKSNKIISGHTFTMQTDKNGDIIPKDLNRNDLMTPAGTTYEFTSADIEWSAESVSLTTSTYDLADLIT